MITLTKAALAVLAISAAFINYCCAQEEGSSCTMKTGEQGICTILPQCKSIHEALMQRKFPFKNLVICSFVDKTEVICCTDNVGAPTSDGSAIIFNQGGNHTTSVSNSPETIATINVERFVTIGNIRITDKDEFIDLAQIGKNLIQEQSRRQFGAVLPRSQSTTKRPSAKVRDLPVYDVTTKWPLRYTTERSATFSAVRDVNSDTRVNEIYGSKVFEENFPTVSTMPFWGKWNRMQKNENLIQESASSYQPSKRTVTIRPYADESLASNDPQNKNIVFPSARKEWMLSSKVVWPDSIKTTSETTIRPRQTHTMNVLRPTSGFNVPMSANMIISTPLHSSDSEISSSVLDEWMRNILIETSGSSTPSVIMPSKRTSTSSSFVGVPNSPDDNNVISPSTTPRNKDPVNLMPGSRTSDRKSDKVCIQYEKDFLQIPRPLDYHILDGVPAFLGEFPHMAALGYPGESGGQTAIEFKCGGSLISNRYVMTAAHCVRRRDEIPTVIRLGGLYLDEVTAESMDVGVEDVILNPQYMARFQYHDIALIRLNVTLPLDTVYIYPACLHTDRRDIDANLQLVAAGWGWTSISKREQSTQLLKANLSTVNLAECNQRHMEYEVNRQIPNGLNDGQLCALDPDLKRDTCPGDSGGPLQLILESKLSKIYGITSFGALCGSAIPSVYARVSFYLDWLESVVWPATP